MPVDLASRKYATAKLKIIIIIKNNARVKEFDKLSRVFVDGGESDAFSFSPRPFGN